jgi:hypothetical protein
MDIEIPDNEDAVCDLDRVVTYLSDRGLYMNAELVIGAARRLRADAEEIARLESENERLRNQNANLTIQLDTLGPQLSKEVELSLERCATVVELRAENERLRKGIVWAVRNGAEADAECEGCNGDVGHLIRFSTQRAVEFDRTDAGLIEAVLTAMGEG